MNKKLGILSVVLALFIGIFLYQSQEKLYSFDEYSLDNGLRVILYKTKGAEVISQVLLYEAGRMDEAVGKSGVAHFLEHLMFRGDNKGYSATIEKMGGTTNAYTSQDMTVYYSMASAENMEKLIELEGARMGNLSFSLQEFASEKDVVVEERVMRYEASPRAQFFQKLSKLRWDNHPYAISVIGDEKEFATVNEQDIRDFYNNYYTPDNAVLVLSGNFDVEKAKKLIEKYYGGYDKKAKKSQKNALPEKSEIEITSSDKNVSDDYFAIFYNAPRISTGSKNPYALMLISEYLGGQGYNAVLYQNLAVENRLVTDISVSYNSFARDAGSFGIIATFTDTKNKDAIKTAIFNELNKVAKDGIPDEKLKTIKNVFLAGFIFSKEDLFETANLLGSAEMLDYDINTFAKDIMDISNEDIKSAMKNLLDNSFQTIGHLQGLKQ